MTKDVHLRQLAATNTPSKFSLKCCKHSAVWGVLNKSSRSLITAPELKLVRWRPVSSWYISNIYLLIHFHIWLGYVTCYYIERFSCSLSTHFMIMQLSFLLWIMTIRRLPKRTFWIGGEEYWIGKFKWKQVKKTWSTLWPLIQ